MEASVRLVPFGDFSWAPDSWSDAVPLDNPRSCCLHKEIPHRSFLPRSLRSVLASDHVYPDGDPFLAVEHRSRAVRDGCHIERIACPGFQLSCHYYSGDENCEVVVAEIVLVPDPSGAASGELISA